MWKFFWFLMFVASMALCCTAIFYQRTLSAVVALVVVVMTEAMYMTVSTDGSIW